MINGIKSLFEIKKYGTSCFTLVHIIKNKVRYIKKSGCSRMITPKA